MRPTLQMRRFRPIFVLPAATLLLAFAAPLLHAQDADDGLLRRGPGPRGHQAPPSTLPPTQPTAAPTPAPTAPIAATPVAKVLNQRPAQRARVNFANGLLEVQANNSSLLQILHDISRNTGMSITGGVVDQRIFGDYGPASPATVLATLLDGTGTNMFLKQDSVTGAPVLLELTQRGGGPTPPSPNSSGFDDSPYPEESAPRHSQPAPPADVQQSTQPIPIPVPIPQPANNPLGSPANQSPTASTLNTTNSVPIDTLPTPSTAAPPPPGIVSAPNPPPPGSTSDANGTTTTPEAIYQQLLQLQKSKAATDGTSPPASTPAPSTPKQQ